ncbi:MAG: hypothetical protein QM764_01755 [Chitinophagaceae bacterium]
MQVFHLLLKNEKIKSYHRITAFILFINLSVFTLFALLSNDKKIKITGIVFSITLLVLLVIRFFLLKIRNGKTNIYNSVSLYIIAIGWLVMNIWWAGILNIVLALLYYAAQKPLITEFNKDTINYSSFLRRRIQ